MSHPIQINHCSLHSIDLMLIIPDDFSNAAILHFIAHEYLLIGTLVHWGCQKLAPAAGVAHIGRHAGSWWRQSSDITFARASAAARGVLHTAAYAYNFRGA